MTSRDRDTPTPADLARPTQANGQGEINEKTEPLRRTTVTFGNDNQLTNVGLEKEAGIGKSRGATIAAPTRTVPVNQGETQDG